MGQLYCEAVVVVGCMGGIYFDRDIEKIHAVGGRATNKNIHSSSG